MFCATHFVAAPVDGFHSGIEAFAVSMWAAVLSVSSSCAVFSNCSGCLCCCLVCANVNVYFLPAPCAVCRICSSAATEVVTFKANKDLAPGDVEWANYIKVRMLSMQRATES